MTTRTFGTQYVSAPAQTTNATATAATQATLTLTGSPNQVVYIFWQAVATTTVDTGANEETFIVQVVDGASTVYDTNAHAIGNGWRQPVGGMFKFTFDGSGTTTAFSIKYKLDAVSVGNVTVAMQDAWIASVVSDATDAYAAHEGQQTNLTAAWTTANTLTFTPGSTGQYLILAYAGIQTSSSNDEAGVRLFWNSTAYSTYMASSWTTEGDQANHWMGWTAMIAPTLTGSQTFTIDTIAQAGGDSTIIQNARILALRMDTFGATVGYGENRTVNTTTSTSYQTQATLSFTPTATAEYLVLQSTQVDDNGAESAFQTNQQFQFTKNGTNVNSVMINANAPQSVFSAFHILASSNSAITFATQYSTQNASYAARIWGSSIAVLPITALPSPSVAWGDEVSVTVTPPTTGAYIVYATAEANFNSGTIAVGSAGGALRLLDVHGATAYGTFFDDVSEEASPFERMPWSVMLHPTLTSGTAYQYKVQSSMSAGGVATTVYNARILAMPDTSFNATIGYGESRTTSSTTGSTYTSKVSLAGSLVQGTPYFVLATSNLNDTAEGSSSAANWEIVETIAGTTTAVTVGSALTVIGPYAPQKNIIVTATPGGTWTLGDKFASADNTHTTTISDSALVTIPVYIGAAVTPPVATKSVSASGHHLVTVKTVIGGGLSPAATFGGGTLANPAIAPAPALASSGAISGASWTPVSNATFGTVVNGNSSDPTITNFAQLFQHFVANSGLGQGGAGQNWCAGGQSNHFEQYGNVQATVSADPNPNGFYVSPNNAPAFDFSTNPNAISCWVRQYATRVTNSCVSSSILPTGQVYAGNLTSIDTYPNPVRNGRDWYWEVKFRYVAAPNAPNGGIPFWWLSFWTYTTDNVETEDWCEGRGTAGNDDTSYIYANYNNGQSTSATNFSNMDLRQWTTFGAYMGKNGTLQNWMTDKNGTPNMANNAGTNLTANAFTGNMPLIIWNMWANQADSGMHPPGNDGSWTDAALQPCFPYRLEIAYSRVYLR